MPVDHARIAINNVTPVNVNPANWSYEIGPNTNYTLQIQNLGSEPVYIGSEGLTSTSYGCSLVAGSTLTIDDLPPQDNIYVLSSAASGYVGLLRIIR